MRTSTKIWLIIAIITNIGLLFFFGDVLNSIKYNSGGLRFELTWGTYVGIILFILANISGFIVFVRFIRKQPLNRQIFFSTIPPTVTFVFLILFFFTIHIREQTQIVTAIRDGLGIYDATSRYIWMGVVVLAYALFLYFTYTNLSKPVKKIEKAVELLRNGKTKDSIKVGNSTQFITIENDLNQINENYKQQEKVLNALMPEKNKIVIEENKIVDEIKVKTSKNKKIKPKKNSNV